MAEQVTLPRPIDQFDFEGLAEGTIVEVMIRAEVFEQMKVEGSGHSGFFRCQDGGWLRFNNVVPYYGIQADYRVSYERMSLRPEGES